MTSDQISKLGERTTVQNQLRVLNIAEGGLQSAVLFTLLKLKLFERIGEEGKAVGALAAELGAQPEMLARLLNAGVVLKLLETADGMIYRLSPTARNVLLPSNSEGYLGNWVRNLEYFSQALSRLDEAVLNVQPKVELSSRLEAGGEQAREFTLAMHDYAALRGKELARYLDTSQCTTLLDLGCGPGTYAFHLGMHNPQLQLYLLDSLEVLEVSKEVRARYGISNQVHYLPLNALTDEIPGSYDLVLVSNILHMIGETASRTLIKRLRKAVNPNGSLVVQAQFLRDDGLGDCWPVMMDLLQLCITPAGRNHSVAETRRWLAEAGFTKIEFCPMTMLNTNAFLRAYKL